MSGLILNYLGVGDAADRPTTPSVATGALALYYAADTHVFSIWDGSAWQSGGGGGNSILNELPSGAIDGSNTAFTVANSPTAAGIALYLNGIRQQPGSGKDYTLSGSTITMAVAPSSGDILLCDYQH